jgi:ferredoxin
VASSIPWATALTETRLTLFPTGSHTVLELAERAGIPLKMVCGGMGNCTTCRVRVVEGDWPPGKTDRNRLGPLVRQGWRLACQYVPRGLITVERPPAGEE